MTSATDRPPGGPSPSGAPILPSFARRLFAVGLFAIALLVLWQLRHLALLLFAAILIALILRSLANAIRLAGPFLGEKPAYCLATFLAAGFLMGFGYMLGTQVRSEMGDIWEQASELFVPLENWLGLGDIEEWFAERGEEFFSSISVLNWIAGVSSIMAGILSSIVLVLVAAFYLGLHPRAYRRGLLLLLPPSMRVSADSALSTAAYGLQRWVIGQLIAMIMVGILTYIGLWLLGVPSALALAVLAGVLEFIPFIGPILSAIPALAIALAESPELALWVLGLYVVVQQIEGNLLMPLIQQKTVSLPPVATLFAVLAAGILFGPIGILLATPLAVVLMITVKKLWVHDALGEDIELPGPGIR